MSVTPCARIYPARLNCIVCIDCRRCCLLRAGSNIVYKSQRPYTVLHYMHIMPHRMDIYINRSSAYNGGREGRETGPGKWADLQRSEVVGEIVRRYESNRTAMILGRELPIDHNGREEGGIETRESTNHIYGPGHRAVQFPRSRQNNGPIILCSVADAMWICDSSFTPHSSITNEL